LIEIMKKESLRIIYFLMMSLLYVATDFGFFIAIVHLVLALVNPKKFGMSRLLMKILAKRTI
jgi:hypothetical protein